MPGNLNQQLKHVNNILIIGKRSCIKNTVSDYLENQLISIHNIETIYKFTHKCSEKDIKAIFEKQTDSRSKPVLIYLDDCINNENIETLYLNELIYGKHLNIFTIINIQNIFFSLYIKNNFDLMFIFKEHISCIEKIYNSLNFTQTLNEFNNLITNLHDDQCVYLNVKSQE